MSKVNILLVEDNNDKLVSLRPVIDDSNVTLVTARSKLEAQVKLTKTKFALVILDIQIPDEIGHDANARGGIDLLEWIEITESCYRPYRVIGVTSAKDTKDRYASDFVSRGAQLFYASSIDSAWVEAVQRQVAYFKGGIRESEADGEKCDVAIITALAHNEFQAILKLPVNVKWTRLTYKDDPVDYYKTTVETAQGEKHVIAACCGRMGFTKTAALTTKTILKFDPSLIVMTGITAGIRSKTNYGDIIIADIVWDWGSGKVKSSNLEQLFLPSPHQVAISEQLRNCALRLRDAGRFIDGIERGWVAPKPNNRVGIVVGSIASGSVVLESSVSIQQILSHNRDTVGIEMESYGFMLACDTTKSSPVPALVIKSVCDFGDEEKSDDWQDYCSYMSANFAYKFITEEFFECGGD